MGDLFLFTLSNEIYNLRNTSYIRVKGCDMTERDRYTNEEKEAEPKETGKEASIVEKFSSLDKRMYRK